MDFLGSTTPQDLVASVTSGVQTTGTDIWPLLLFIGIPLAFAIGAYVVSLIRHASGSRSVRK